MWGAPESKLSANAAVRAAPAVGELLLFEGVNPELEDGAADGAAVSVTKPAGQKVVAEDVQKQMDELSERFTKTKEQLDDAQRALQVQANKASARERGLHEHIAQTTAEGKDREQELQNTRRQNEALQKDIGDLKKNLEKKRQELEKRDERAKNGSAACAIS